MHFKIEEIIEYASQWIGLNEGDLILTGTPVGAGPLKLGDKVEGIARVGEEVVAEMSFRIAK
jgi:2-keto-4-pentenoate hydratase/2-oxohepta-3-ene-1,7-dioic acid hydratase in catechol pathway